MKLLSGRSLGELSGVFGGLSGAVGAAKPGALGIADPSGITIGLSLTSAILAAIGCASRDGVDFAKAVQATRKQVLAELRAANPGDSRYDAKILVRDKHLADAMIDCLPDNAAAMNRMLAEARFDGAALAETLLARLPEGSRFEGKDRDFFVEVITKTWAVARAANLTAETHAAFFDEFAKLGDRFDAIPEEIWRLTERVADHAREMGIKEGLLIALARKYAEGNPRDFDAALRGLERALEVAAEERKRGALPSNLGAAVDAVVARVDALNDAGEIDAGLAAVEAAIEEQTAGTARLYDKAIAQATLTRNVPAATRHLLARQDLDAPADPAARFAALRTLQDKWYARGRDKGLNFDLEVAIALAEVIRDRAMDADQRGAALNDLAIALSILGERESDPARLEQAVAANRAALEESSRERVPLNWATTQNNLGNALSIIGARDSNPVRLEQAVTAYRAALEERTRERVPLDWAMTQNNLGVALESLGKRQDDPALLEQAVAAYRAALEERTRERVPLDWASTTANLSDCERVLARLTQDADLAACSVDALTEVFAFFEANGIEHHAQIVRKMLDEAIALRDRLLSDVK